jgi:AcrR family transcriptional regulator
MPRSAAVTRKRILDAAYVEFRRKGYARVGVDEIALAAKVTKRTLYYHFDSKDALLAAVLGRQHELAVLTWDAFSTELPPRRLIAKMFDDLTSWTSRPRWGGSGFSRVAMELADLPGHPARAIASRHKSLIEARLAEALARGRIASPKIRAREIWLLSEGAMTCMVLHGDPHYVQTAKRAALRLLGHPKSKQ